MEVKGQLTMNATIPTTAPATQSPPSFLTLPTVAAEVGVCDEALARSLTMSGMIPDGIVNFGKRRVPIFAASRIPNIRSAVCGCAVAGV